MPSSGTLYHRSRHPTPSVPELKLGASGRVPLSRWALEQLHRRKLAQWRDRPLKVPSPSNDNY